MCQGCAFNLWIGHIQEATDECVDEQNNKAMFFSLFLSLKSFILKVKHTLLMYKVIFLTSYKSSSVLNSIKCM